MYPRLLTLVLEIAVVWTVLSFLLAGTWVLALEIVKRSAFARTPPGQENLPPRSR